MNYILGLADFDHLIRGGTLKCGDTQIALDDVGFELYERIIHKASVDRVFKPGMESQEDWTTLGETREVT